jgi:hypothetical protein
MVNHCLGQGKTNEKLNFILFSLPFSLSIGHLNFARSQNAFLVFTRNPFNDNVVGNLEIQSLKVSFSYLQIVVNQKQENILEENQTLRRFIW